MSINEFVKADLLIEIGCEELPAKQLQLLRDRFAESLQQSLHALGFDLGEIKSYATPRRLAVLVHTIAAQAKSQTIVRKGPSLAQAYDAAGKPTAAALGFAKSCFVTIEQLGKLKTEQGDWLYYEQQKPGESLATCLPGLLEQVLAQLCPARVMRWGDHPQAFVRAIRWVTICYDAVPITGHVWGLPIQSYSYGHRFHAPQPVKLTSASQYVLAMENAYVMVDFTKRKENIYKQILTIAEGYGLVAGMEDALLEEVTGLVEWPTAVCGQFDKAFLDLPQDILIAVMRDHQRYFPLFSQDGRLAPRFVVITNHPAPPENIVAGNEKVIRPRLADAAFFFAQDRQVKLEDYRDALKGMVFQQKLGSLFDKTERLQKLAVYLAKELQLNEDWLVRAAALCKADLATQVVGEFPELQGIMGGHYARLNNEPHEVFTAISQHYQSEVSRDYLDSAYTQALAIIDRIDNLVGIFGIGQAPNGSKDPFGLRRAAMGIVRIAAESGKIKFNIKELLDQAVKIYGNRLPHADVEAMLDFIYARAQSWFEGPRPGPWHQNPSYDAAIVRAVLAIRPHRLDEIEHRLTAVKEFHSLPQAPMLAEADKRVRNLLAKAQYDANTTVCEKLLTLPENALYKAVLKLQEEHAADNYTLFLQKCAELQEPIANFFAQVMVMVDDETLRRNRLALLASVRQLFLQVADISYLHVAKEG